MSESEKNDRAARVGLRWERQQGNSWYGYSGRLVVAMLGEREADEGGMEWWYSVRAVHTKWITKGHGEVQSERSAKRACDRAWSEWLAHAGLVPAAVQNQSDTEASS